MKEKIINYVKTNYRETAVICCITLCALILRIITICNFGELWLDELYSWYFASQKNVFITVFELVRQDLHMPIYFIILHFWMKIFGQSDISMHLCTLLFTLPLIPISFYSMKFLFNKTTGYFAAIMFAINTFCIYYSAEVRFYGLIFVLSLLTAVLFVKMLENFDKKYITAFLITHSLLVYTYSMTPLLTVFYALVGFVYVYNQKRESLKIFIKNLGIAFAIAVPSIICTIYNFIVMRSNLCSFTKDIYVFDWKVLFDILENYFSSENLQIITGAINAYRNLFENLQNPIYAIFVGIPILIGLIGFIKSFFAKNEKLALFLFPSLLFIMFSLLFGACGLFSFLTRYTAIVFPVIICATCFGLSQLKIKNCAIILVSAFVILNYSYLFISPKTVLYLDRSGVSSLTTLMNEQIKPKDDDIIFIPYSGSRIMRYIPHGTLLRFNADDALLLKDRKSCGFYFDRKYYTFLNRESVKSTLTPYILEKEPFELYDTILNDFHFEKMQKGQKFIIISYRDSFTMPYIKSFIENPSDYSYENVNLFSFLMGKITFDSVYLAQKYLKGLGVYVDEEHDYSVYIFEK